MSKKVSMESDWAGLPAELIAIISDCLKEADITRFRGVCRPWRSSVMAIPNKLSPLFPRNLSSCCLHPWPEITEIPDRCKSRPNYLIANAIYLVRPLKNNPDSKATTFMLSLQESKAGKLLLRHALTYRRIIRCSGDSLHFLGWSITHIAISHNFRGTCDCPYCHCLTSRTKVVIFTPEFPRNSDAMALFAPWYRYGMYALRNCLSNNAHTQFVAGDSDFTIEDHINFNGCIYGVDNGAARVYVLHHGTGTGGGLQLLRLTCVNLEELLLNCVDLALRKPIKLGKRFVVSGGDLYLVFNVCEKYPENRHRCYIYKLVMDDINNATSYCLEKIDNLGDKIFFINRDCSFSVSARDLHLPDLGNHIFVSGSAFLRCDCKGFRVHHVGDGKPVRAVPAHSALFQPPSLWINQLQHAVSPKEKKNKKKLQLPPGKRIVKMRLKYITVIRNPVGE